MHKFTEKHLTKNEKRKKMETLNIHVSVILTEFVIKTFPQKEFQVQMVSLVNSIK